MLGDVFQNRFEALIKGNANSQIYNIAVNDYVIFKGAFKGPVKIELDSRKIFLKTNFEIQIDSIKTIPVKK